MELNECEYCSKRINDPVCFYCNNKEAMAWISENIGNRLIIGYVFDKMRSINWKEYPYENHCILCRYDNVSVCRVCYFNAMKKILIELNMHQKYIEDFTRIFGLKTGSGIIVGVSNQ